MSDLSDHVIPSWVPTPAAVATDRTADYVGHNAPILAGASLAELGLASLAASERKAQGWAPRLSNFRRYGGGIAAPLAAGVLASQVSDDPVNSRLLGAGGAMLAAAPSYKGLLTELAARRTYMPKGVGGRFRAAIPLLSSVVGAGTFGLMGTSAGRIATQPMTAGEAAHYAGRQYPWLAPTAAVAGTLGAAGLLYYLLRRNRAKSVHQING